MAPTKKQDPIRALVETATVERADRNNTAVEPAVRAKAARNQLDQFLLDEGLEPASRGLKGTGLDPEAFLRAITTITLTSTLKLSENTAQRNQQYRSVLVAAMNIATLGLHPAPQLGQAWLVPFRDWKSGTYLMQLIVGYQGFVTLAGRAGWTLSVEPIWEGQEYSINLFAPDACYLKPLGRMPEPGEKPELMAFIAHSVFGGRTIRARPYNWYLNARERSESWKQDQKPDAKRKGPWTTDELAMVSKTVVRWERKTIPMHDPTSLAAARLNLAFNVDGTAGIGELPPSDPMEALLWTPDRHDVFDPGEEAERTVDLSDSAILAEIAGYVGGQDCNGRDVSAEVDTLIASHGMDPQVVVPVMLGEADGAVPPRELLVAILELCRSACNEDQR